ncbi:MAG: hypothetical protein ACK56I_06800, partial [bacterium]
VDTVHAVGERDGDVATLSTTNNPASLTFVASLASPDDTVRNPCGLNNTHMHISSRKSRGHGNRVTGCVQTGCLQVWDCGGTHGTSERCRQ